MPNGIKGEELFNSGGITFNDFNIMPGYINFLSQKISLKTNLTKTIQLNLPVISSPMDTVTESKMAIAMALSGGIGIIHYNNTINEQVRTVKKVKRFQNGFILEPVTLGPENKISDVDKIKKEYGFSGIPIIEDNKLIGIVTNRDIDFIKNRNTKLKDIMTPFEKMVVLQENGKLLSDLRQIAIDTIKKEKIGKLPIIDKNGKLVALISRNDIKKTRDFPQASIDSSGRLLVGAAISTHNKDRERFQQLYDAGIDVVVIDAAQGWSVWGIELIKWIKENYKIQVIGGNVVTRDGALALIQAGVDAIKIGLGGGAICTTQEVMACGRAQCSAIFEVYNIAKEHNVPAIADGGISCIGHITKALAIGASTCMMGGMFAGTSESPGEYFYKDGIRVKTYRGMASLEAMKEGGDKRYFSNDLNVKVAQGVSGTVVDKGSTYDILQYIEQGLKLSFQDIGIQNMQQIHKELDSGELRFETRSFAAQCEGGIHNLHSYDKKDFHINSESTQN